jgi:hypothetical protein
MRVLTKKGVLRKDWEGKIRLTKHAYLNTEYLGILVDSSNALVKSSPTRLKNGAPGDQLRLRPPEDDDVPAQFHRHAGRERLYPFRPAFFRFLCGEGLSL